VIGYSTDLAGVDEEPGDSGQVTGYVRGDHPQKTQQRYQQSLHHKGENFNYSTVISNMRINAYESSRAL